MRWLDKNGELQPYSDNKYRIKWEKKAPSKGSAVVKEFLKKYCFPHILFEEYRLPHCLLRVDFIDATKKMAIEFNGRQHKDFVRFFHANKAGQFMAIQRDVEKRDILERNGFKYIEIWDDDLPLTKEFFKQKGIII